MLTALSSVAGFHLPIGARVLAVVVAAVLALSLLGAMGKDATYGRPGAAVAGAVDKVVLEAQALADGDEHARLKAAGLLRAAEIVAGGALQRHTEVDLAGLMRRLASSAPGANQRNQDDAYL